MLELLFTLFVSIYDSNTQQVTYKGIQDLSFTQCVEYLIELTKVVFQIILQLVFHKMNN